MITRLSKSLILGEDTKENVANNKGAKLSIDGCIWCEKLVWISEFGYTEDNPISDIAVNKALGKDAKALHKLCLAEIVGVGVMTINAVTANLKSRGEA